MSGDTGALTFLWLVRSVHHKRGAEGLIAIAERYELENDPQYADIPRLLRAFGERDPDERLWDEIFSVAIAATDTSEACR